MKTKQFPLNVVLTASTFRLLTTPNEGGNGIEALYDILGWMTNDSPFTHQLPRFSEECKPWLLRWFPELEAECEHVEKALAGVVKDGIQDAIRQYLHDAEQRGCKATYDIPRIPRDDHEVKHPYDELVQMRGTDEGIFVVPTPS